MLYILKANTTDYGWSFKDCHPVLCNSYTIDTGLNYIFEADNDEEAEKKADEFTFYFEQEYVGESNITETYDSYAYGILKEPSIKKIKRSML